MNVHLGWKRQRMHTKFWCKTATCRPKKKWKRNINSHLKEVDCENGSGSSPIDGCSQSCAFSLYWAAR